MKKILYFLLYSFIFLLVGAASEPKKIVKERVGSLLEQIGNLLGQTIEQHNEAILSSASINKKLINSMNSLVERSGFFALSDKEKLKDCRDQLNKISEQLCHITKSLSDIERELSLQPYCAMK